MRRIGTGLLWAGGIVLGAYMVYTLALDQNPVLRRLRAGSAADASDVAVMFPEREYWAEFRAGIDACAGRGLARVVEDGDDFAVIETPIHRHGSASPSTTSGACARPERRSPRCPADRTRRSRSSVRATPC